MTGIMRLSTTGTSHGKTKVSAGVSPTRPRSPRRWAAGHRPGPRSGTSSQAIYLWRRQEEVDRGLVPGLTSAERAALTAAKRHVRELEAELEIHRWASELLAERSDPNGASRRSLVIAAEGCSVLLACRVLAVSESGFYARRQRPTHSRLAQRRQPG